MNIFCRRLLENKYVISNVLFTKKENKKADSVMNISIFQCMIAPLICQSRSNIKQQIKEKE